MLQYLKRLYFDGMLFLSNHIIARIPSHNLRILFYRRCMRFNISWHSLIFMNAWFDTQGQFSIGKNSVINQKCRLDNRGGLYIGDNVAIASEVVILTADHDMQSESFAARNRTVIIEDFVFVGTRAIIMPGVKLGRGCAVGAGSVVTKDVPANSIVAGVPARQIGVRECEFQYDTYYPRLFF